MLDKLVIEGKNFTFAYEVYNLGTIPALTIKVKDDGIRSPNIMEGSTEMVFENLAP